MSNWRLLLWLASHPDHEHIRQLAETVAKDASIVTYQSNEVSKLTQEPDVTLTISERPV